MDVTLDESYSDFQHSRRVLFVNTLKDYYKDPNSDNILIRSVKAGSTQITWLNESLSGKDCSDPAIAQVTKKVVDGDKVNSEFQSYFQNAGFKVDKAAVHKIGIITRFLIVKERLNKVFLSLGKCGIGASAEKTTGNDIYISTVVPAVVVSSLLLLACCIACILYKKKKRVSTLQQQQPAGITLGISCA